MLDNSDSYLHVSRHNLATWAGAYYDLVFLDEDGGEDAVVEVAKDPESRLLRNSAYMESCGIVGSQLSMLLKRQPWLFIVQESVLRCLVAKLNLLCDFGFSKDECMEMFRRTPGLLRTSEEKLKFGIDFFLNTIKFKKSVCRKERAGWEVALPLHRWELGGLRGRYAYRGKIQQCRIQSLRLRGATLHTTGYSPEFEVNLIGIYLGGLVDDGSEIEHEPELRQRRHLSCKLWSREGSVGGKEKVDLGREKERKVKRVEEREKVGRGGEEGEVNQRRGGLGGQRVGDGGLEKGVLWVGPQVIERPTFAREEPLGVKMHQRDKDLLDTILEELKAKIGKPAPSVGQGSVPTSSTFPFTLAVTPTSHFDPRTEEMLHFVEDDNNSINQPPPTSFGEPIVPEIPVAAVRPTHLLLPKQLCKRSQSSIAVKGNNNLFPFFPDSKLNPGSGEGSGQSPPPLVHKVALPKPHLAFDVTWILIPRPKKKAKIDAASTPRPSPPAEIAFTVMVSEGVKVMPSPLASISATTSLPKLFKEFGQLKPRLRSSRHPSEPQSF
ncbi:hypothetical protein D8674_000213 [Pyrus ussuriensis x Pyrus communis]|uniref:Uncharacterized protein n=1 Tax=Pyrus ussuriensis x Pyrus communis TaxID=2448454 RepID=A0A5N5F3E1_9ROSA|nr:hypothetical protein D8674_000213 [Pyrus ussuriensis x Pyrus communis]